MVEIKVDPKKKLAQALKEAGEKVSDLTIPLTLIAQQWFKSNRAIFDLSGPGKYVDLSDLYRKRKESQVGFVYPILKRTGAIERSITKPSDANSVNYIIGKKSLLVGTNVAYAIYHQSEGRRSKMPRRPMVLFGNEQVAPGALEGRIEIWQTMIYDYVAQVSGAK